MFLILLLAVLSVGGTGLVLCSVSDPERFAQLTEPSDDQSWLVRAAGLSLHGFRAAGRDIRAGLSTHIVLEPPDPQVQSLSSPQAAGDPVAQEEPEPAPAVITELVRQGDRELLTGGLEIIYFNQKDEAWAEASFGGDPVGVYGCGPTTMAMAVASMTGTETDPAEMAAWCARQGYRARRSGSYLSIVPGTAEAYGLDCASLPTDEPEAMLDALERGGAVVALMGPGHFTSGGHFILLHGVTGDGQVLVADPNSRDNSLAAWDPRLILDELSDHNSSGGPLWALSLPAEPELPEDTDE